jgi:hypothetical protein
VKLRPPTTDRVIANMERCAIAAGRVFKPGDRTPAAAGDPGRRSRAARRDRVGYFDDSLPYALQRERLIW